MLLLSVDIKNFVAEFDVKFIHKSGDRQKSAASLGTTDKKSHFCQNLYCQHHKCISRYQNYKLHSEADAMVNESSQPKPGDAVLGGNNPPPIGAAVLGGIEGVKQRCANPDFQARIAGLQEAVKYMEPVIELLLHNLKDEVSEVGLLAYSLLQENVEPELKRLLEIYEPWEGKISNLNIVDPVELFHSYLEVKQPQNFSLYEAIQILDRGTAAEKEVAFLHFTSSKDPLVKAVLWSYINSLEPQVANTHKLLKYFLALNRWQEAKQESEKILLGELGRTEITAIPVHEKSALSTLQNISRLWKEYAVIPRSMENEPLDFFRKLNTKIEHISSYEPYEPPDRDIFSRRSYSESHD
jgi:hypothetical protein